MKKKNPPQKSDKWSRSYKIQATIRGTKRIWLRISYHYKKRNVEYLKSCKRRGIKPEKDRLFNNQVIRDMVQQLDGKELESKKPEYYAYRKAIDKRNNRVYEIIIFLKNDTLDFVDFINLLYPSKRKK